MWFDDSVVVVGESTTGLKVVNGVMTGCGGISSGNFIAEAVLAALWKIYLVVVCAAVIVRLVDGCYWVRVGILCALVFQL